MRRVCAWCSTDLNSDPKDSEIITHGICSSCAIKLTSKNPRTISTLLNYISEPVFVIDHEGRVKSANDTGKAMLGKEIEDLANILGGDVFECTYSKEKGGCGKTEHCKTCAIRNTVMDTLVTGDSYYNIPAFQSINTPDGPVIIKFNISTERVNDRILLRIDAVKPLK